MAAWILLGGATGEDRSLTLRLPPGSVKTIGRTARADFVVEAALVSRLHCRLTAGRDGLTVEDLGSTNGTLVNGRRVDRSPLEPGDTLQVGRLSFEVKRDAPDPPATRDH